LVLVLLILALVLFVLVLVLLILALGLFVLVLVLLILALVLFVLVLVLLMLVLVFLSPVTVRCNAFTFPHSSQFLRMCNLQFQDPLLSVSQRHCGCCRSDQRTLSVH
jgi:hypothetical protein